MKTSHLTLLITASVLIFCSGCSINHYVADDYDRYVAKRNGVRSYPTTELKATYTISEATMKYSFDFRSFAAGYAHRWVVEFGKMLEVALESGETQKAFASLTKLNPDLKHSGTVIHFDLISFKFARHTSHALVNIVIEENGKRILDETYEGTGIPQSGKAFWGGAFAMKNAVHVSTDIALQEIIRKLISDINLKIIDQTERPDEKERR